MHGVQTVREMFDAIAGVKAKGSAYCANFLPVPNKIEGWIARHQLKALCCEDAVFFLRRDRDFWHLHFCARDLEALRRRLREMDELSAEPVVCDLVGETEALAETMAAVEEAGLRPYKDLLRMARTTPGRPGSEAGANGPQIDLAQCDEGASVLGLIEQACDRFAKQIPTLEEIEAAIVSRQILTLRCGDSLAGLLHYETRGGTSTLRYWVVAPSFRDRRVGSTLMNHYLSSQPHVRRFVLWVNSENQDALLKYRHYHYRRDGVVDHVLANDLITR